MQQLINAIRTFADQDTEYGWFEFVYEQSLYKFPKRAFMHYLFHKSPTARALIPAYKARSPSGLKMHNDNPFHTDVWLGAGFALESAYEHNSVENTIFYEACYALTDELQSLLSFDFTVLANGLPKHLQRQFFTIQLYECMEPLPANTTSNIHILCQNKPHWRTSTLRAIAIPHAGIEFDLVAQNADVILTEAGGPLAHLATVSREKGKLLLRVPDACNRFPPFTTLSVNLPQMRLTVPSSR